MAAPGGAMWWSSPLCVNLNLNGGSGCSPAAVSERGKSESGRVCSQIATNFFCIDPSGDFPEVSFALSYWQTITKR